MGTATMTNDDRVGLIMAFEQGDLGGAETLRLFADLVKTGMAWSLQGSYGRAAASMIERGILTKDGEVTPIGQALVSAVRCRFCGEVVTDERKVSGAVDADWATDGGDFGCSGSPDTNEEGCGSHEPQGGAR